MPITPMFSRNGPTRDELEDSGVVASAYAVSSDSAVSRMWPAIMLARSRTASEKGRTRNSCTNSIGVTRTYSAFGTPGGKRCPVRYLNPWLLKPDDQVDDVGLQRQVPRDAHA